MNWLAIDPDISTVFELNPSHVDCAPCQGQPLHFVGFGCVDLWVGQVGDDLAFKLTGVVIL